MRETGEPRRTGFQFSLGTLMLWVTLSAVALSFVLVVGPWIAVPIILYVFWLVLVRIKWEFGQGLKIATLGTAIFLGCIGIIATVRASFLVLLIPFLFVTGLLAGFYGFILVHFGVSLWQGDRLPAPPHATEQLPGDDTDQ